MDMHSAPVAAKRMWSYLRAVFFMMRKGVLSKCKLLVGMHLVMKRRNKAVARSVANLLSHHHHHHHGTSHALRRREYEFSCSNSPGPGSFSRRRLAYFPCLGAVDEEEPLDAARAPGPAATALTALHRIECYAAAAASPAPSSSSSPGVLLQELSPPEEECTPMSSPLLSSTGSFSVRVSNYSSEEYGDDLERDGSDAVDDEAEEFISRFYEQLRRQNKVALLPYLQESAA